jgi:hypothetical protein
VTIAMLALAGAAAYAIHRQSTDIAERQPTVGFVRESEDSQARWPAPRVAAPQFAPSPREESEVP